MIGPSLGIETRSFKQSEEGAAWQWIEAEPAAPSASPRTR